jgi:small subunit ribosomal protein S3Ae
MSTKPKRKKRTKKALYKDKTWFSVITPKIFKDKDIGEIIGLENNVIGRVVEALLYDFTGNYNDISLKLRFRVMDVNVEATKCNTIFIGHQYTNDFIRSLIGRGSSRISTIENLTTKDNYKFRVTTICTTIRRARSSQQIIIRKIMRDILNEFAKGYDHEKFIHGMIYGEFQNQIARVAKTIYPLANATIIKSKLVSIPEGGKDSEVPDKDFDIVEVDVKRSRKSDIKRTERINVKKFTKSKTSRGRKPEPKEEPKKEPKKEEKVDEVEEKKEEPSTTESKSED